MKKQLSRRGFMKKAAAATVATPLIAPRLSLAAPASSKIQHAAIGVAGQGKSDLAKIFSSNNVEVAALCDIDAMALERASKIHPGARLYRDWREMLAEESDKIDSVNVSTPDHTHAPAAMTAIRNGLHVYCEKPLTHEVYEARKLTQAAEKYGVATQMGNQIHSHDYYRTAVHWIQEGAIGKVKEWHSWCSAIYTNETKDRPEGVDPIPEHIDWNLWIGTAQMRPYKAEVYHPFEWRQWRDFGGGGTGDFGCHIFDPVFTALGIGAPYTISVEPECVSDEVWPAWIVANYVFPGTDLTAGRTIKATWMDGIKRPDPSLSPHLPEGHTLPSSGSMLIGEEGTLIIPHVDAPQLYPVEKYADYPKPDLEPLDHYHNFVDAAMGNCVAGSHFGYSGPLTEAVLLANVANRFPNETLEWHHGRMKFTNHREANRYLKREYRAGFEVDGL